MSTAMLCPHCVACDKSDVVDSRSTDEYTYRRRRCKGCGKRFTTFETWTEGKRFRTLQRVVMNRRIEIADMARKLTEIAKDTELL